MRSSIGKGLAVLALLAGPVGAGETPAFTPEVKLSGFLQSWATLTGDVVDFKMAHARLVVLAKVDEETVVNVLPEMSPTGFVLLNAFVKRTLEDGWSVFAGQFKPNFGDDRYLTPAQFKRTNYFAANGFVFPDSPNPWDIGIGVQKKAKDFLFEADLIQGAGPNKAADTNGVKDLAGKLEYQGEHFAIGASYYGGTGNVPAYLEYQNWFGVNARFEQDGFDARAEGLFAPMERNAYVAQLAYRTGDVEPLVWGEIHTLMGDQAAMILGGALNVWAAPKTRLTLSGTLTGVTDLSGPKMGVLQVEQKF